MTDRMPQAIEPHCITHIKSMAKLFEIDGWLDMPVDHAVGIVMKFSGGAADPEAIRKAFIHCVEQSGLKIAKTPQKRGLWPLVGT